MPSTPEAVEVFLAGEDPVRARARPSNAGGVATSGLEMAQNAMHLSWSARRGRSAPARDHEVDPQVLRRARQGRHDYVNYVKGANVAGFIKVANAMIAQGVAW